MIPRGQGPLWEPIVVARGRAAHTPAPLDGLKALSHYLLTSSKTHRGALTTVCKGLAKQTATSLAPCQKSHSFLSEKPSSPSWRFTQTTTRGGEHLRGPVPRKCGLLSLGIWRVFPLVTLSLIGYPQEANFRFPYTAEPTEIYLWPQSTDFFLCSVFQTMTLKYKLAQELGPKDQAKAD